MSSGQRQSSRAAAVAATRALGAMDLVGDGGSESGSCCSDSGGGVSQRRRSRVAGGGGGSGKKRGRAPSVAGGASGKPKPMKRRAASAPPAASRPDGSAWTSNPYVALVTNTQLLKAKVKDAAKRVKELGGKGDGGALLLELGEFVEVISEHADPAFEQDISRFTEGAEVVIVLGECPLRMEDMVTRGKAKTTGIIDAFECISGAQLVRKNNSFVCLRKGNKDGEELAGGAAGCDTHNKATSTALAEVLKLFVLGLRASGCNPVLIIGFSNAAGGALTGGDTAFVKTCEHGVVLEGRKFLGIDVVLLPHAKYALAPTAVDNDTAVCARMGVEHPFRSSRMCEYLAGAFAEAAERGASEYDFSDVEDVPEYIYERVREDKDARKAGIFAVPWEERHDGEMSDDALAELKEAISIANSAAGKEASFEKRLEKGATEEEIEKTRAKNSASANKCMIEGCTCTSTDACVCDHDEEHLKASSVAGAKDWDTSEHDGQSKWAAAGGSNCLTVGAYVDVQLVDESGAVACSIENIMLQNNGRSLVPCCRLQRSTFKALGLGTFFDIKRTDGKPYFTPKARQYFVALQPDAVAVGKPIAFNPGTKFEASAAIASLQALRSTGVDGKPATIGATLRFVLRSHAPMPEAAAAGGAGEAAAADVQMGEVGE